MSDDDYLSSDVDVSELPPRDMPTRNINNKDCEESKEEDDDDDVPNKIVRHEWQKDEEGKKTLYLIVNWKKYGNSYDKLSVFGEEFFDMVKEYVKAKHLTSRVWSKFMDPVESTKKQKHKPIAQNNQAVVSSRSGRKIKKKNLDNYET